MKTKVILFDFDGTIADTLPAIFQILNRLSHSFGYKRLHEADIEALRDKSSLDILKFLEVSYLKLPFLVRRAKSELYKEMKSLHPIEGMRDTLQSLRDEGYVLGILSSNAQNNVEHFLETHRLGHFDYIYTTGLWNKSRRMHQFLKQQKLKPQQVLYVGDETRDIEAAKRVGLRTAAVTWGVNSAKILHAHEPDFLVHSPEELVRVTR